MNSRLLCQGYDMDSFLYYIDNDIKKAWYIVAEWYLDDLYELLDENDIEITLTMSPDEAITHLGNAFYDGYRRLYSWNRCNTKQIFPDFDTESSDKQITAWKYEVWPDIISCMIEVYHNLGNDIKIQYDASFANDFLSLCGTVDLRTIYGMIYKNNDDTDRSSIGSNEEHSDAEYDSEHSH
jgi:hypothetical protein